MSRFQTRTVRPVLIAAALGLAGTAALAQDVYGPETRGHAAPLARVLAVTANVDRISEQTQQCTQQQQVVTTPGQAGLGTTVAGSLIGGALGSQIGKGSGKAVAVATGSAVGAHMARNMAEQKSTTSVKTVQVCQPVTSVREQVRDYTVRYEWDGREHVVNLPQHPGAWLRVSTSHTVHAM